MRAIIANWFSRLTERRVLLAIDAQGYNVAACVLSLNWEILKAAYFDLTCWIEVGYKIKLRRASEVALATDDKGLFIPVLKAANDR